MNTELRNVYCHTSDFNIKIKKYNNGMNELRLYKKSFRVGEAKEPPKLDYWIEPFENTKIVASKNLSADGFTIPQDNEISMKKSMNRTITKIYDYANSYDWQWFCTFTFNRAMVEDRTDFVQVSKYMMKWLDNMKQRYCKEMKYVLVPEKHKNGAWHFHGLFADCDGLKFVEATNNQEFTKKGIPNKYYGQPLKRKGVQIYNITRFKGFTDCTKIRDTKKASSYITKYITKDLIVQIKNKKRYWCSKGLPVPKEENLLIDYGSFEEYKGKLLLQIHEAFENVYTNEVTMQHGDFENEIVYYRFSDWNGTLNSIMGIGVE